MYVGGSRALRVSARVSAHGKVTPLFHTDDSSGPCEPTRERIGLERFYDGAERDLDLVSGACHQSARLE